MEILKNQHRILELLYKHHLQKIESNHKIPNGLNWNEIAHALGVTSDQLYLIAGRLVQEEEIVSHAIDDPLLYEIKIPKGFAALASKKYLRERKINAIDNAKNLVSILIPVLALALSFTIYIKAQNKQEQQDKEIKALKSEVQQLQERIK